MAKPELAAAARELRAAGKSHKEIAHELCVSPGSVHRWCRDIILTTKQEERLSSKGAILGNKAKKALAEERRTLARELGRSKLGTLSDRDLLLLGVGLYWGEGFKTLGTVGMANMDPNLMRVYIRWLGFFGVAKSDLKARLHLAPGFDVAAEERWWCQQLNLELSQFTRAHIKISPTSKRKIRREAYHGVLSVLVNDTQLHHQISAMINVLFV